MASKKKNSSAGGKSIEELRIQRALESAPVPTRINLPEVKAPSLDKLEVTVPRAPDVTKEEVERRLHEIVRMHAQVRDREMGEALAMGDQVLLDVIGYAEKKLIPFSVRSAMSIELAPDPMLPGFCEALVGQKVGEGGEVELTLPENYPVQALRGKRATFLVDIRAAQEVTEADLDDEAFVSSLGLGNNHDEVIANIVEQLEDELADELVGDGRDKVFDELLKRAGPIEVPDSMVDEEIRRNWQRTEARILEAKKFEKDELDEALAGWLSDPLTRADATRRIKVALVLKAIRDANGVEIGEEQIEEVLDQVADSFGVPQEEVLAALRADPIVAQRVKDTASHLYMVEWVMAKAKVNFEGAANAA